MEKSEIRKELIVFIEWWNELPDESDDKLFMTEETIDRYFSINSDAQDESRSVGDNELTGKTCHDTAVIKGIKKCFKCYNSCPYYY